MEILMIVVGVVVGLVVLFLLIAAFIPRKFYVERKLTIHATADTLFNEMNSFQKWEKWSPWIGRDSTIQNTYSGPESGVGNKVSWTSKKSGSGSMEIMESIPSKLIRTKLTLNNFAPFEGHFTFIPINGATEVVWADTGNMNYPFNIINLFADAMMGKDFEKGLSNLKAHVEPIAAKEQSSSI